MKWAQMAVCSVSLHERIRVVRPSRSVTVQVTIRDQNGASQQFQALGASIVRDLHDTTSSVSINIRGKISPNIVTPRLREIERDRFGWQTGKLDIGAYRTHPIDAHTAWV